MSECRTHEDIREHLFQISRIHREMVGSAFPDPRSYVSVAEYIADHGRPMQMADLPGPARPMKLGECYSNAYALAKWSRGRYLYCEGFAGIKPRQHAWVFDTQSGNFYDPTWSQYYEAPPIPYLGCVFPFPELISLDYYIKARAISLTQQGYWTYAIPVVAHALRGESTEAFGPWCDNSNRSWKDLNYGRKADQASSG